MICSRVSSHLLSIFFLAAIGADAQLPRKVVVYPAGVTPPAAGRRSTPPSAADVEKMLTQINGSADRLMAHPPALACAPAADKLQIRSSINVDLSPSAARRDEPAVDWSRFAADDRYSHLVEARFEREHIGLGGLVEDVFSSNVPLAFDRWDVYGAGGGRLHRVAVFHYGVASGGVNGNREAIVYADPDTGSILRILFRGFDTQARVASLNCWPERR